MTSDDDRYVERPAAYQPQSVPEKSMLVPRVVSEREFYALSRVEAGYVLVVENGMTGSDFRELAKVLPKATRLASIELVGESHGEMKMLTLTFDDAAR